MTFTVHVHYHMLPDFFWRATNEGDHPVGGIAPLLWSRASRLSFLDDAGIDVAVTSVSTPGVHTFARTPDVKFVFSHAGGTMPYLAGRFGIVTATTLIPRLATVRPQTRPHAS